MTTSNRKYGLGRGLDAILSSPDTDITSTDISGNYVAGAVAEINIDFIETNPFQPRNDFDEEAIKELAESIKSQGIIQPVTVRKMGRDRYQLISGERRLRASRIAGLKTIPVFIRVADDEQMLELALIENTHRESLNAIEVAISYQRLIDECKLTIDSLSEKVGKDRTTVTNFLRLLKLPPEVQIAIRDRLITMGHARAIINIEDKEQQLTLLKEIIDKELTVRQVEDISRNIRKPEKKEHKTQGKTNVISDELRDRIEKFIKSTALKTKLTRDIKGKGSITISFKNDDDLKRIINIIEKA